MKAKNVNKTINEMTNEEFKQYMLWWDSYIAQCKFMGAYAEITIKGGRII